MEERCATVAYSLTSQLDGEDKSMDNYILDRMRADAAHLITLGQNEAKLQHQGLKGRFRELLINDLLAPWLPPYISCGTGMIIADKNIARKSTQDDVIIFDKSLIPPILASTNHASEGVFLFNSVIARIEVKSTLTKVGIEDFIKATLEITKLNFSVQEGFVDINLYGPINCLFAYASDAKGADDRDYQLKRVLAAMEEQGCDPLSGKVSIICIPQYGFWMLGKFNGKYVWQRLITEFPADNVVWFAACLSNTCFQEHARRQGRDPSKGLEGGIGNYLPARYEIVRFP